MRSLLFFAFLLAASFCKKSLASEFISPSPSNPSPLRLHSIMWFLYIGLGLFAALTYSLPLHAIWFQTSLAAFVLSILRFLFIEFFAPLKEKHAAKEFGAGATTQRLPGPTPPPYPNGWFVSEVETFLLFCSSFPH
jgi:hypothetical protein